MLVETQGLVTTPVSAAVRVQITKCYNTTRDVQVTFDDGYSDAAFRSQIAHGQASTTATKLLRPPGGAGAYSVQLGTTFGIPVVPRGPQAITISE